LGALLTNELGGLSKEIRGNYFFKMFFSIDAQKKLKLPGFLAINISKKHFVE